jgi:hypothetical protein
LPVSQCLGYEPIQSSSRHVGLKLTIPFRRVELGEPCAKSSTVFGRQSLHGGFKFFDGAHV